MKSARAEVGKPRLVTGQRGISLVELLVAMSIMSVITAMLLMGWFSLSRSWGFTTHSADARDSGRQAMQRMQREIRDAQKPAQWYITGTSAAAPDAIIYRARPYWIAFSTTFNELDNGTIHSVGTTPTATPSPTRPHLVVYRLYRNGELWRYEDNNKPWNGKIDRSDGLTFDMLSDDLAGFDLSERTTGEGATLIVSNVVNDTDPATGLLYTDPDSGTPLFEYNYYDSAGALQSVRSITGADRQDIIAVQLRLLVDLNPVKAPVFADLRGTAQLRNAR